MTREQRERLRERVRRNVAIDPESQCWIWQRKKNSGGYGFIQMRLDGYRHPVNVLAHRLSYTVFKRTPPAGLHIAHSIRCISRLCVNPEHLRATDQASNERDKAKAERWWKRRFREIFPPTHLVEQEALDRPW